MAPALLQLYLVLLFIQCNLAKRPSGKLEFLVTLIAWRILF